MHVHPGLGSRKWSRVVCHGYKSVSVLERPILSSEAWFHYGMNVTPHISILNFFRVSSSFEVVILVTSLSQCV